MKYVTHARTLDELKLEFISDLNRRLALVEYRIKNAPSARRSASMALIRDELTNLVEFWNEVELVHSKRRETP